MRDYERHCQRAQPTGAQPASSPSVDMRGDTSAWGTSQAKEELSESGTDVSLASVSSANTAAMITSAALPETSAANSQLGTLKSFRTWQLVSRPNYHLLSVEA